jgi:hypothetical protein
MAAVLKEATIVFGARTVPLIIGDALTWFVAWLSSVD